MFGRGPFIRSTNNKFFYICTSQKMALWLHFEMINLTAKIDVIRCLIYGIH